MASLYGEDRRPHIGDFLRAAAYTAIGNWALLYILFPPVSFVALATYTRLIWLGITALGALIATIGCLTRLDVKVELPGVLFMLVGPLFYTVVNLWFIFLPSPLSGPVLSRCGFACMTISIFFVLLPRAVDLYSDALRTRALNASNVKIPETPC